MFLTPHTLTGLAIARYTGDPLLVFVFAIIGHFVLDVIPHGDNGLYDRFLKNHKDKFVLIVISIDFFFFLGIIVLNFLNIFKVPWELGIVAILGSILPDLFTGLHLYFKDYFKRKKIGPKSILQRHSTWHQFLEDHNKLHDFIHYLLRTEVSFRFGLVIQFSAVVTALFFIFQ